MLEFPTGGVPGRWGTDCYATLLTMLASHPREQAGHLHGLRRPRKQEQSLPAEHASSPTTTRHPTFTNRVECFVHPHNDRVDAAASDIELERREHVGAVCRRNLPRDSGDDAEAPLTSGYSTASSPECLEDSGGVMASLEAKIPTRAGRAYTYPRSIVVAAPACSRSDQTRPQSPIAAGYSLETAGSVRLASPEQVGPARARARLQAAPSRRVPAAPGTCGTARPARCEDR